MAKDILLSSCPACDTGALVSVEGRYGCEHCGLWVVKQKKPLFKFRTKEDHYLIEQLGDDFTIARQGILDQTMTLAELGQLRESVYADQTLAAFAAGDYEALNMPASTLAQILLEQLRETCYLQINSLRRAQGPILEQESSRFPQGKSPVSQLTWQDNGNLFLTNIRLVFPSNAFTFIRLDRKVMALKTYEDGIGLQRRGEDFATYFVGCRANEAALAAAYIMGKQPLLRPK